MRALIQFAILVAVVLTGLCSAPRSTVGQQTGKINWHSNPQQAASQAAAENKLVLLHFTADWCGPCQTQTRFVFSNPTVANAVNRAVIPVRVDIDSNRTLAGELGVTSIPTDVFLTAAGEVVVKRKSPLDAQNYIKMVGALRSAGPAPQTGAMAKLDQLKRKLDPMNLPRDQRSSFGANGPGESTVGVSKEAIQLAKRSNFRNLLPFRNQRPRSSTSGPTAGTNGSKADIQAAINALAAGGDAPAHNVAPTSPIFNIPADPSPAMVQSSVSQPQQSNHLSPAPPVSPQRGYEMQERQEFLARKRPNIEFPKPPTNVQPVRVMNENFLAPQVLAADAPLKPAGIPGLQISGMIDPRTGRTIPDQDTTRSIARFKREPQPSATPAVEARIVPRQENRIAGHAAAESTAAQAAIVSAEAEPEMPNTVSVASAVQEQEFDKSDFGLQGKCPVTLVMEGAWVDGDTRWGIVHRDRTYLFSSEENYRLFQKRPDHFSPILAGYDPVEFHTTGQFVDGLEENGVFMEKGTQQQIVLFASAENRSRFQTNPQLYMRSVRKALYTASRADTQGTQNAPSSKLR